MHVPHPPLSVVCRFAHLLNQSQEDFLAEAELLKLQEEVVRKIRSNQQLQQDLNLMDIKIGLLVKNQITLQVRGRAAHRQTQLLPGRWLPEYVLRVGFRQLAQVLAPAALRGAGDGGIRMPASAAPQ